MLNINVEELHSRWLDEMQAFSWAYLTKKYGLKPTTAVIVQLTEDDHYVFETKAFFNLPAGADKLILHMARYARCTFGTPDEIRGFPKKVDVLPEPTLCLHSLLEASFPKNTETDVFKAHDGAISVGDLMHPDEVFRSAHIAFAGLGVILMQEIRKNLSPLSTNDEIKKMVNGKFLSIYSE